MTTIKQPTSSATETILAQNAEAIRALGKRVIGDIIKIGRLLTEAKKIAGHGNWLPWIKREFGWTDKTAQNFMSVHAMALKNEKFSDLALPVSGLYALAAPSTPEEAREVVVARAESGERLSNKDVRNQINETRKKTATKTAAPAQTESAIPIYGPCAGECVVTEKTSTNAPALASQPTTTTADKAPEPKMKKSGSSELLNSIAWADASVEQRTRFLDAVGVKSVWDAMTPLMRDTVRGLANVKPPEPAKRGSGRPDLAIPDDGSIPEFLRRT